MKTQRLKSFSTSRLLQSTVISALLFTPLVAHGQTFFGSGGTTNSAPYIYNVGLGYGVLSHNTSGTYNTADGLFALGYNTTGSANSAFGFCALISNTTGSNNTANGFECLAVNTSGSSNTASGYYTLHDNTTGYNNTAYGFQALLSNTTGFDNVASGYEALYNNTMGSGNTAQGYHALYSSTTGNNNTAVGYLALFSDTTGFGNIAYGNYALYNTNGYNNLALGYSAGYNLTTGGYNIDIANSGVAGESGVIRLGTSSVQTATYIAGINGVNVGSGVPVYINSNGQLGTITSSARFKNDIKSMGSASDRLMQLRPVTFRYKDNAEKGPHAVQYGLIAEEVAKVYPDLVQYDKAGKPFTVYYHLLTPMLLNELQKTHHQNEAQKVEITTMKATLQQQNAQMTAIQAAHTAEITTLKAELTALKHSQQQQFNVLAKLTALVETSQKNVPQGSMNRQMAGNRGGDRPLH